MDTCLTTLCAALIELGQTVGGLQPVVNLLKVLPGAHVVLQEELCSWEDIGRQVRREGQDPLGLCGHSHERLVFIRVRASAMLSRIYVWLRGLMHDS